MAILGTDLLEVPTIYVWPINIRPKGISPQFIWPFTYGTNVSILGSWNSHWCDKLASANRGTWFFLGLCWSPKKNEYFQKITGICPLGRKFWHHMNGWQVARNHKTQRARTRVCLKIGYIPNYSHLIGIMTLTIGFRGTLFSDTHTHPKKKHNGSWWWFYGVKNDDSGQFWLHS